MQPHPGRSGRGDAGLHCSEAMLPSVHQCFTRERAESVVRVRGPNLIATKQFDTHYHNIGPS
jgi:hypothetical protein